MEKKSSAFFSFLKSEKGGKIILAVGILAILCIFLSGYFSGGDGEKSSQAQPGEAQILSADEYAAKLENKLTDIVGSIAGAGDCKVMVTLENGIQYDYAQ